MTQFDKGPVTISIIMPAYNVEQYIAEAIESVLQQTCPAFELIIINDGSTDDTQDVLAAYMANPLIKIFHQPNQGLGSARNAGLARAAGEYVYFFDSDDVLRKDCIEQLESLIQHFGRPDMVLFAGESFIEDGYETDFFPDYRRTISGLFRAGDYPGSRLLEAGCYFASACLYVSKRQLWLEKGLQFKPILHEDEEIIFPLLSLADQVCVTEETLFLRRIRHGSIMTSEPGPRNLEACQTIFQSLLQFCHAHDQAPYFDRAVYEVRMRHFFREFMYLSKKVGYTGRIRAGILMIIKARIPGLFGIMLKSMLPEHGKAVLMRLLRR